jgi:hypothetical protein
VARGDPPEVEADLTDKQRMFVLKYMDEETKLRVKKMQLEVAGHQ